MRTPAEYFAEYLSRKGLKMTPQRKIILQIFLASSDHVSAEDLYKKVTHKNPAIGQATVYRTLKLLENSGLAVAVDFGDGTTRYEPNDGRGHHDHLICELCGKNVEIVDKDIEQRQQKIAEQYGFTLSRHTMYLFGICPACQQEEN